MTYIVSNTDGSLTLAIEDNSINGTDYSVVLLGKNVIDYGRYFAQNSIRQLENFASASPPVATTILKGQLWFDKTTGTLKVYNNTWRPVSTQHAMVDKIINYSSVANLPPAADVQYAAAVFNNVDNKLYIDNGTRIQVAGYGGEVTSRYSASTVLGRPNNYGTRVRTIYLTDTANVPRAVLAFVYVNDTANGSMNKGTTTTRWGKETIMSLISDHDEFTANNALSYTEGEEINYYLELNDSDGIGAIIKRGTNARRDYTAGVDLANQANEANVAYWLNTGSMGSPFPGGYFPAGNVIHTNKTDGYIPETAGQNLGTDAKRFSAGAINTLVTNTLKVGSEILNPATGYTLPTNRGTFGYVLTTNGAGTTSWSPPTGGGGGGGGGGTVVTVESGAGLIGGPITGTGTLAVGAGTGISVSADAVAIDTTWLSGYIGTSAPAPGTVSVLDEGSQITGGATSINFTGAGVTSTASGTAVTVTIPGGGSSLTIPGSSGQLLYNNGGSLGALSALTYTAGSPNQFALTGRLSITNNLTVSGYVTSSLKIANQGLANEGGEIRLQKPTTGSDLVGDLAFDLNANRLRIFDSGGDFTGLFADITTCAINVGSEIIHSTNFSTYITPASIGAPPKPRAYGKINKTSVSGSSIASGAGFVLTASSKGSVTLTVASPNSTGMSDATKVIILATPRYADDSKTTLVVNQTSAISFIVYTGYGSSWDPANTGFSFLVYYADDLV